MGKSNVFTLKSSKHLLIVVGLDDGNGDEYEADHFDGSHRVEVDLAHMVQLVPVRVGLVYHRALQLHLVGGWQRFNVVVTLINMVMIIIKITS